MRTFAHEFRKMAVRGAELSWMSLVQELLKSINRIVSMADKCPISGQCGRRAPNPYPAHLIRLFLIVSLFELVPQRGYGQTASSEMTSCRPLSELSRGEAESGNRVRIRGTVRC